VRSVARPAGLDGAPTGLCGAAPRRLRARPRFRTVAIPVTELPSIEVMPPARRKVVVRRIVKAEAESAPLLDASDVDQLLDAVFAPRSEVVPVGAIDHDEGDAIEELTDGIVEGWEDDGAGT
jgi:hypothetical protein